MKNIDLISRESPPNSVTLKVSKIDNNSITQEIEPIKMLSRIEQTVDRVELSITSAPPITYHNKAILPATIGLPKDYSYINLSRVGELGANGCKDVSKAEFIGALYNHDELDEARDTLRWIKNNKKEAEFEQFVMLIVENCADKKIQASKYFTEELGLKIFPNGGKIFGKVMQPQTFCFKSAEGDIKGASYSKKSYPTQALGDQMLSTLIARNYFMGKAIEFKNLQILDRNLRNILNGAHIYLKLTENQTEYKSIINELYKAIDILTPEYQNKYILKFYGHFVQVPKAASGFSKLLMDNCQYEIAKNFLEED